MIGEPQAGTALFRQHPVMRDEALGLFQRLLLETFLTLPVARLVERSHRWRGGVNSLLYREPSSAGVPWCVARGGWFGLFKGRKTQQALRSSHPLRFSLGAFRHPAETRFQHIDPAFHGEVSPQARGNGIPEVSRRSGSRARRLRALDKASQSPGGTSWPSTSLRMNSGMPAKSVATMASPWLAASMITFGSPSRSPDFASLREDEKSALHAGAR